MYGYSINAKVGDEIKFNTESTAVTLLLMSPYLLVTNPLEAQAIIDKIKIAPTFNEFKNNIGDILVNGSLTNQSPYIDLNTVPKYKIVVTEVLNSLNQNYNITQNGMQIIDNSKVGNELKFKIRNYKKRYSTVYAEKYKNGQLVDTNIKIENGSYETHQLIDSGEFDWVKAWKQIFSLNPQDQITKNSEYFMVNTDNADKIFIKCYGLGLQNGSFPSINSKEYKRGIEAVVHTAVFDIIKPTMSVVEGFQDWGNLADLRGRPNDDPTKKLINKFLNQLLSDSGFYNDIAIAATNNNKKEIYNKYYNKTIDFILDDSNAKLYLDIMKKNSSDEKVIAAFRKSLKGFFKIKAAGDITGTAVNLGEAVAATFTTDWTSEFIINTDGTLASNNNPYLNPNLTYGSVTDIDGNTYATIQIGTQTWMAENLKTTKYNDGTPIPNVTNNNDWSNLITGAWSYYNNDAAYNQYFGKLYNKQAASSEKICPIGWHISTLIEWQALPTDRAAIISTGNWSNGTGLWENPNVIATNSTGLTINPGGYRAQAGSFWMNHVYSRNYINEGGNITSIIIEADNGGIYTDDSSPKAGYSCRCVKN